MEWLIKKSELPKEIVQFINAVFELVEIRGRVGQQNGIEFSVRSNEKNHPIPHVHARYGEYEISIAIETAEILAGNLPPKRVAVAQKWVLKHKNDLLTKWNDFTISATSTMTISRINTCLSDDYEENNYAIF
ncbi:MAG: DUF4160 domain-containing protein [Clostridia bacterium]|nr:DUF4160 domain-containing protein [Clostridia bacterium]